MESRDKIMLASLVGIAGLATFVIYKKINNEEESDSEAEDSEEMMIERSPQRG